MRQVGFVVVGVIALSASVLLGQRESAPPAPPINDTIARLNRGIAQNQVHLSFEPSTGYLRSVLKALDVPLESQLLVFSETSRMPEHITMANPRALYFNDNIAVGWVNGNDSLELMVQDPRQGILFYTLDQKPDARPQFAPRKDCALCHISDNSLGIMGPFLFSVLPMADNPNEYVVGWSVDQRTPIQDRWGGWYVTGTRVPNPHLGNVPVYHAAKPQQRAAVAPKLTSVAGKVKADAFLTQYSDVVAQMVLDHQVTMMDQLVRMNAGSGDVTDFVDYLLFANEAPLTAAVEGNSGFAEKFAALGPRDHLGRSLRQFDLRTRLMKYPCSYMIYSEAFDALPAKAKNEVYDRMWQILSGKEQGKMYSRLSLADRQAVVDILRDTKKELPSYFQRVTR